MSALRRHGPAKAGHYVRESSHRAGSVNATYSPE